jgi:hypothetical protein
MDAYQAKREANQQKVAARTELYREMLGAVWDEMNDQDEMKNMLTTSQE